MNEAVLIQKAIAGSSQAFERLLDIHYETLFKFAYSWCGNQADAEDITQLACIKLARSIDQFRFEATFTSWLYRLVINCAKDWNKSQARHDQHRAALEHHEPLEASAGAVEQVVFLQQVLHYLDDFPDGMKETALLVHAEGFTHGEAAQILCVKESTVSWRIHEIRKKLQSIFGREGLANE